MLKTLSSMGQRRQNIFQDGRFLLFCEAPKKIQSSQKLSLIFFECVQNSKWHQTAKNSLEMLRTREILVLTFFPGALTPNYFRAIGSLKRFFSRAHFSRSQIQTRGSWVRSANATAVLCCSPFLIPLIGILLCQWPFVCLLLDGSTCDK